MMQSKFTIDCSIIIEMYTVPYSQTVNNKDMLPYSYPGGMGCGISAAAAEIANIDQWAVRNNL